MAGAIAELAKRAARLHDKPQYHSTRPPAVATRWRCLSICARHSEHSRVPSGCASVWHRSASESSRCIDVQLASIRAIIRDIAASHRALRDYTRLANKPRAWDLWDLENGEAEAAPLSETTATAARTAAAATGSLKNRRCGAPRRGQTQPQPSRAPRSSYRSFARSTTA